MVVTAKSIQPTTAAEELRVRLHGLIASYPNDLKELLFETVINKRQVKIKFDLDKLKYKGKLEI
jgi:hypothetical protein